SSAVADRSGLRFCDPLACQCRWPVAPDDLPADAGDLRLHLLRAFQNRACSRHKSSGRGSGRTGRGRSSAESGRHPNALKMISAPALNALLNASSAALLLTGYAMIRQRRIAAHKTCMLSAFACSAAFLISYVVYHWRVGVIHFQGTGWIRPVYFGLL